MDFDKSLDDLIGEKKGAQQQQQPRRQPRQSGGRASVPYSRPSPRSTSDKWVHDAYTGPGAQGPPRQGPRPLADGTPAASAGVGFTGVSPRIEVIGLHYEVTPQDLKNIFSAAGTLVQGPNIRLRLALSQYDRSGRSRGEATMEYASYQQAKTAIDKFDGAMTKGQTITIRLLPPVTHRSAPGPGGPPNRGQTGVAPGQTLMARLGAAPTTGSPVVTQTGLRGGARGTGGRGGPRGGRGGRGGAAGGGGRARRGPATEGDLDKEIDSFMTGGAKSAAASQDVDMA